MPASRRRRAAPLTALLAAASLAGSSAAQDELVGADWVGEDRLRIRVTFDQAAALVDGAGSQPSEWEAVVSVLRTDGAAREVEVKEIELGATSLEELGLGGVPSPSQEPQGQADAGQQGPAQLQGKTLVSQLTLVLAQAAEEGGEYAVELKASSILRLDDRGTVSTYAGGRVPLAGRTVSTEAEILAASRDQERDADGWSLTAGDTAGAISFHYVRGLTGVGGGLMQFEYALDGDLLLDQERRFDYFNNLSARVQGYRGFRYDLFGRETYGEFGLHYEFDSDQKLENADHLLGLQLASVVADPLSRGLARLLAPPNVAALHPLWTLQLDYAMEAISESSAGAPAKPDTENGAWRASGGLDWRLPLGRELDWKVLPSFGAIQSLDLSVELDALFDFDLDEWFNTSRISLRFSPEAAEGETAKSFAITWAHGESSPIFENVDALLVGLHIGR